MARLDWTFAARSRSGTLTPVKPIIGGTFSYDDSRTTARTLSGLAWLPVELAKIDLSGDDLIVYLALDGGTPVQMAVMRATSSADQKDILTLPDGTAGDLSHVDFADDFIRLNASSEQPFIVTVGTPPDGAMAMVADIVGLDHAFAGSNGPMSDTVSWAPFTPLATILNDLALQAGQRPPWSDRLGVARSVQANVIDTQIIDLATLKPIQGTIAVSNNYLSAPDRVVVYDQSALAPLVGIWNAPASSPSSAFRRGYSIAVGVAIQGVASVSQAQQTAQAYGERQMARSLSVTLAPEAVLLLDGPVILSYLDTTWLVRSWSIATQPGSTLSLVAAEVVEGV